MKYKTLLFDADGTLLDFQKSEEMALLHTFQKYEIPLNEDVLRTYETINASLWKQFELGEIDKHTVLYTRFVQLFKELQIESDGVLFEDDYQQALGEGAYLLDQALPVVQRLAQDHDLYIVTNGVSRTQYSRLEATGLQNLVKDVFVSEDIGFQKPQKEYFDIVFSKIKDLQKETTLIIGDSLSSDIRGGIIAGIDTCWFHTDEQKKPEGWNITYEIHDLRELFDICKGC